MSDYEFPRRLSGPFFKVKANRERMRRKPKGVTGKARASKKATKQRAASKLYPQVDLRDGRCSRLTGIYWGHLIHRHHMEGRGVLESLSNLISLGPDEHLVGIHGRGGQKWLRLAGDANVIGGVEVWRKIDGAWVRQGNI